MCAAGKGANTAGSASAQARSALRRAKLLPLRVLSRDQGAAGRGLGISNTSTGSGLVSTRWNAEPLATVATQSVADALRQCASVSDGLTSAEAEARLAQYGANEVAAQRPLRWPTRLLRAVRNPLVILLSVLATISLATGDIRSTVVMVTMVVLGVALRFTQEARADRAAAALRAMIHVTATAIRDGTPREIPLSRIVPGDVVLLAAGDMVPGDARVLAAKDLFVNQSSLTGESFQSRRRTSQRLRRPQHSLSAPTWCFWERACRAAPPRRSSSRRARARYSAV